MGRVSSHEAGLWRGVAREHDRELAGPTGHFKKEDLGLQAGDVSIVHTLANLDAINKRNRGELARTAGALEADQKRVKAKRADKTERAKAVRKLLARTGIKVRGGVIQER